MNERKPIVLLNPSRVAFGAGCFDTFINDFIDTGYKRLFIVSIAPVVTQISTALGQLRAAGIEICIADRITAEPSFDDFEIILKEARAFKADSVAGIGGGSVLDTAKLVAAQLNNAQSTNEIKGIGNLKQRSTYLACIPTTAGTGSEMSPNAIFLDNDSNKIGVISRWLVPDAAYIDPALTISVPSATTAATGIDALAHCLEAYTNKFAHPLIDTFAMEGVRRIAGSLLRATKDGTDLAARSDVALGSMYGGICLGPVNTTAVHALAYPLGTDYHLSHGLSIALLLPAVMAFNLSATPERYAAIATAMGVAPQANDSATALAGIEYIRDLIRQCGLPSSLKEAGVLEGTIDKMATDAMKVQRLLKNNIREVTQIDAVSIYKSAFLSI